MLGGGWALGRVVNLVGDKAVGKTLLAIEACANFALQYPEGHIWYREAEAAFDESYAVRVGLPLQRVDFGPDGTDTLWDTVEDIFEDMVTCAKQSEDSGQPGLYIVDSLDALSCRSDAAKDIDSGYRVGKARVMSELFKQNVRKFKKSKICFMMISQARNKIGVTFGDKKTRSGGQSLDFYSSQIVYLSHITNLTQTRHGVKRVVGTRIRAKCKKNKVGMSHRECEFVLRFLYGVDDVVACLTWLKIAGKLRGVDLAKRETELDKLYDKDYEAYHTAMVRLQDQVKSSWDDVEKDFTPTHSKYGDNSEKELEE
jgi:recombination protein RecA